MAKVFVLGFLYLFLLYFRVLAILLDLTSTTKKKKKKKWGRGGGEKKKIILILR